MKVGDHSDEMTASQVYYSLWAAHQKAVPIPYSLVRDGHFLEMHPLDKYNTANT